MSCFCNENDFELHNNYNLIKTANKKVKKKNRGREKP